MASWTNLALAVRASALQNDVPGAEVILRIGAIANALTSIGRAFTTASGDARSALDERDRQHLWIVVASYLNEAQDILNRRHNGLAWRLAEAGERAGATFPGETPLARLRGLFERDADFMVTCKRIRDKFAFHIDKDVFIDWLKGRPADEGIGLISQLGPTHSDMVFDASANAIAAATEAVLDVGHDPGSVLSEVVLAFPYLVEAMARGFAHSNDLLLEVVNVNGDQVVFAREK